MSDQIDDVTFAKLRFLANAAVAALSDPGPQGAAAPGVAEDAIAPDAAPRLLRQLLLHAVPVLRAAGHRELVAHIEKALEVSSGEAK